MVEGISLIHGNCLEKMKDISDKSIDLCLTDPPYGTTACKWDSVIPFEPMWEQLKRIVKDNGAICLFGSEPFSSHLRISNLKMFKYDWVWHKNKPSGIALAGKQPMRSHEIISVFYNKIKFYPILEPRDATEATKNRRRYKDHGAYNGNHIILNKIEKYYNPDMRNPTSVKYFKSITSNNIVHPTQKPVPLLEYLIKTYTIENETVLDFTMGSGSTGVACKNLNRKFIGIEKDDKYFEIARNRIYQHKFNLMS